MALKAQYYKHTLNFRFEAGTSRGVLKKKDSYFLKLFYESQPEIFGLGEAGPLEGLSLDFGTLAENKLQEIVNAINSGNYGSIEDLKSNLNVYSSVLFALETALLDIEDGGKRQIFNNSFFNDSDKIKINGLVWMGNKDFMKSQIIEKLESGHDTIKLKIGAIDFDEEIELLKFIRKQFSSEEICLRVDANGAFSCQDALDKLKILSEFDIHSIEQPIKVDQWDEMADLCQKTPVPIALDEELIPNSANKEKLLKHIQPQFIILKPSLMGGLVGSRDWISNAESLGIKWWMTSALESNVGLNAICQFAKEFDNPLPQGLGTGKLYDNNFQSPLTITSGKIFYKKNQEWDLSFFKSN
ncbi:o-succinylbenzoate synthase [Lacihabitans sp. CCS-44]|uniref:o-succinylbenzoate synthase n=1 Tax=Lacihabitans sp. CCS-44 TaxID=2487331 RepID=UPI0020CBE659|nr:o-succinylbenzoate synthase [Lacihabitans sp. CCS-44]MCP9757015.1 o-succinylbenzoate synthase [Lacihabitans sp. CCS-44]